MVALREEREQKAKESGVPIHCVCCYCGLASKQVEAGGMWYCPNARCAGPAGGQHRHVLECQDCRKKIGEDHTTVYSVCDVFSRDHECRDDA